MFAAQRRWEAFIGFGMNTFIPITTNATPLLFSLQKSRKAVAGEMTLITRPGWT